MKGNLKFIYFLLTLPGLLGIDMTAEVRPGGLTYRGAIIDSYQTEVMLVKLTSPGDVIASVMKFMDFDKMSQTTSIELRLALGYLEKVFQARFEELVATYSQSLRSHYPINTSVGNSQLIEVSHHRQKRNPLRLFMTFLRAIRPVAKVGGKLTRFGKFARAMKYTGYAITGVTMTYEIGTLTGLIPDFKYEALVQEIDGLHSARIEDLAFIKNLTLATTQTNEIVDDIVNQFNKLVIEMPSIFEIKLHGSILLASYLSGLQYSLSLLAMGKIPSSLLSIDTQFSWLQKKLPSPLLASIGTISPHLRVKLANIDAENRILLLSIEVPRVDAKFQLMNFVEWEPMFFNEGICYTSPIPKLYLGYPVGMEQEPVIRDPLIFDPQSCLDDGFILCESDSVLNSIPQIDENKICTKYEKVIARNRRSLEDLYLEAKSPIYDIRSMINTTLEKKQEPLKTSKDISELMIKIVELEERAKSMQASTKSNLKQVEQARNLIFILLIVVTTLGLPLCIMITIKVSMLIRSYFRKRKEEELSNIRRTLVSAHHLEHTARL